MRPLFTSLRRARGEDENGNKAHVVGVAEQVYTAEDAAEDVDVNRRRWRGGGRTPSRSNSNRTPTTAIDSVVFGASTSARSCPFVADTTLL